MQSPAEVITGGDNSIHDLEHAQLPAQWQAGGKMQHAKFEPFSPAHTAKDNYRAMAATNKRAVAICFAVPTCCMPASDMPRPFSIATDLAQESSIEKLAQPARQFLTHVTKAILLDDDADPCTCPHAHKHEAPITTHHNRCQLSS